MKRASEGVTFAAFEPRARFWEPKAKRLLEIYDDALDWGSGLGLWTGALDRILCRKQDDGLGMVVSNTILLGDESGMVDSNWHMNTVSELQFTHTGVGIGVAFVAQASIAGLHSSS